MRAQQDKNPVRLIATRTPPNQQLLLLHTHQSPERLLLFRSLLPCPMLLQRPLAPPATVINTQAERWVTYSPLTRPMHSTALKKLLHYRQASAELTAADLRVFVCVHTRARVHECVRA